MGHGTSEGQAGRGRDERDERPRLAVTVAITGEEILVGLGEGVDVALDLAAFASAVAAEMPRAAAAGHTEATLRADELIRAGAPVGLVAAELRPIGGGEVVPAFVVRVDGAEVFLDFSADGGRGALRAGCSCAPNGNGRVLCAHQVAGLLVLDVLGAERGVVPPPSRFGGVPRPAVPETLIEEADLRAAVALVRQDCRTADDRAGLDAAVALIRRGVPIHLVPHSERHPDFPGRELVGCRGLVDGEEVLQFSAGSSQTLIGCTCGEPGPDRPCAHIWAVRIALLLDVPDRGRTTRPSQQQRGAPRPTRQQRRAADRAARRARGAS